MSTLCSKRNQSNEQECYSPGSCSGPAAQGQLSQQCDSGGTPWTEQTPAAFSLYLPLHLPRDQHTLLSSRNYAQAQYQLLTSQDFSCLLQQQTGRWRTMGCPDVSLGAAPAPCASDVLGVQPCRGGGTAPIWIGMRGQSSTEGRCGAAGVLHVEGPRAVGRVHGRAAPSGLRQCSCQDRVQLPH